MVKTDYSTILFVMALFSVMKPVIGFARRDNR